MNEAQALTQVKQAYDSLEQVRGKHADLAGNAAAEMIEAGLEILFLVCVRAITRIRYSYHGEVASQLKRHEQPKPISEALKGEIILVHFGRVYRFRDRRRPNPNIRDEDNVPDRDAPWLESITLDLNEEYNLNSSYLSSEDVFRKLADRLNQHPVTDGLPTVIVECRFSQYPCVWFSDE